MKTKLCATVFLVLFQLAGINRVHAGGLVAAWGDSSYGQITLPAGVNSVKAIALGPEHGLALRSDGTVVAWGHDYDGDTRVPPDLPRSTAIAAGLLDSLILKPDGTVMSWGGNYYGSETNVPAGLSNVVAIAAGWYHSLALKSDGTVVAWGYNYYGQTNVPARLSDVIAIAAGGYHNLALRADGTVAAWGNSWYGQTNVPIGLSNVVAIAAGGYHSLALKSDGTVVAWGGDGQGQTNVPPGLSNVVAIAAGYLHCLALKADGTIVAWGYNYYGQTNVPSGLSNATAIAAGGDSSLALVFSGPVQITQNPQSQTVAYTSNATFSVGATGNEPISYQWYFKGRFVTNSSRITGATSAALNISNAQFSDISIYTVVVSNALGSVISSGAALTVVSPPFITGQSMTNLTVGAGTDVSLFVSADGTPPLSYQWLLNGTNLTGATGATLSLTKIQPGMSGIYSLLVTNVYGFTQADISLNVTDSPPYILTQPVGGSMPLGRSFTFTVSARGSLPLSYQWRFNGQDFPGATNTVLTLTNLNANQSGYYEVVVSNPFGTAVSAKVWLGIGQTSVQVWSLYSSPYGLTNMPPGLTNAVAVAAGPEHIIVLKREGTIHAWGVSQQNQYSSAMFDVPSSADDAIAIAASYTSSGGYFNLNDSSMALKANGTTVVWAETPYLTMTNLPVPAAVTNVVAIADGGDHYVALKSDGTVFAWSLPAFGYTAPAGITNPPPGLSNVVAVAAGNGPGGFSLALRNDGTVVGWGSSGSYFGTNIPAGLSNVIAISASWDGTCLALKADGTVTNWGWGGGSPPSGLSNVVAISAGFSGAAALKSDGTVVTWGSYGNNFPSGVSNVIALACGGGMSSGISLSPFLAYIVGDGSPFVTIQ